jgi:beta-xylosidase
MRQQKSVLILTLILFFALKLNAQKESLSKTWVPDLGNGKYKNPVIAADYSDPDVIRVGENYYLVSSSFDAVPGLPILQSKDLVNWTIIGHALKRQPPFAHFEKTQHGNGVWAPSIRFHQNEFYIYYPDPDFGIYVTKAKNPAGPWSDPVLVEAGKGLIDPCPLWDTDGNVYLVHAYAGSRAGIKTVLVVKKMNATADKVIDEGKLVYDGHELDPTIEGPKFYKRNGFYYIFAPAGGVATGWQVVLRSKNVYGPYERKVVMDQGKSPINGPHQGAWVDTPTGEDWFLHFQDKEAYGRVVHLQPMKWINNWPIIGIDADGDGIGTPVLTYTKPKTAQKVVVTTPAESDEFNGLHLGLQWQWQANPMATWAFMNVQQGALRLFSAKRPDSAQNLWEVPNLLMQKFPADQFTVTTKIKFVPNTKLENETTGLVIMGMSYASIALKSKKDGIYISYGEALNADKGAKASEKTIAKLAGNEVYFRVTVDQSAKCSFFYSSNGIDYQAVNSVFQATPGKWIGAKVGLFCVRDEQINDSGYADVDYFRVEAKK